MLLLGTITLLQVVLSLDVYPGYDALKYFNIADFYLAEGTLDTGVWYSGVVSHTSLDGPLYFLVLAGFKQLTGSYELFFPLSCLLLGLSVKRLVPSYSSMASVLLAGVTMVLPPVLLATVTGTRDLILAAFMVLSLTFLLDWCRKPSGDSLLIALLVGLAATLIEPQGIIAPVLVTLTAMTTHEHRKVLSYGLMGVSFFMLAGLFLTAETVPSAGELLYFQEFWFGQADLVFVRSILGKWGLGWEAFGALLFIQGAITLFLLIALPVAIEDRPLLSLYLWSYVTLALIYFVFFKTDVQYTLRHFLPVLPVVLVFLANLVDKIKVTLSKILFTSLLLYSLIWALLIIPPLAQAGHSRYGLLSDWLQTHTDSNTVIYTTNPREINYFSEATVVTDSTLRDQLSAEFPTTSCCDYVIASHFPRSHRNKLETLSNNPHAALTPVRKIRPGDSAGWTILAVNR